jgi:hypothetical protein
MTKGIFATAQGMYIVAETTHAIEDLKKEVDAYVDTLFMLAAKPKDNA